MFLKAKRFLPLLLVVALLALSVSPALVGAQTENGFDAEDGVVVSGTVDITGYADDPNFVKWDLFVLPGGDDTSKIWVATGEEAGEFSVTIDTTMFPDGDHALSLRIVKSPTYNYDEYILNFTIANEEAAPAEEEAAPAEEEAMMEEEAEVEEEAAPAEEAAPEATENGFDAEDGVEVSGTVDITGYADDPNFAKWQLDVLPFGSADDAIFLALGEDAGEFSVSVDTTEYPDGDHVMRLRVVKNPTLDYDEYFLDFTIANEGAAPAEEEAAPAEEEAAPAEEEAMMEEEAEVEEEAAPAEEAAPEATENGFDAEDGVVISGTVDITGYADDPNFVKWDLFVLPGGDDTSKIWVATGEEAGEFSVTIDTTMFPDGDHALSLRIVKSPTYNYDEYLLNFTIDNSEEAES